MKPDVRELSRGFSLLSDPTQLGILRLFAKGPRNVKALCKTLRLKQPTVSHHLGLLRMGRLVNGVHRGKVVIYTADKAAPKGLASNLAAMI